MFRFLRADWLIDGKGGSLAKGVLIIDHQGRIDAVLPDGHILMPDEHNIELHRGVLCPGFINTHCHLELSAMEGQLKQGSGMVGFIGDILKLRPKLHPGAVQEGIVSGEQEMLREGIVGVGDISNTSESFAQKSANNLRYHTFIEVFDLEEGKAGIEFKKGLALQEEAYRLSGLSSSIVPHAPYTVTPELFDLIKRHGNKTDGIISYHSLESLAESELYESHSGPFAELYEKIGISLKPFKVTGQNALRSTLPYFSDGLPTLLVHNTFATAQDIAFARDYLRAVSFCFCPKANLYIEKRLPDFNLFYQVGANCTIGTDSLASNDTLSVLKELQVIEKAAPGISVPVLIQWATLNGAKALGWQSDLGSFEKGKKPGVNLIMGCSFIERADNISDAQLRLTEASYVKRVV